MSDEEKTAIDPPSQVGDPDLMDDPRVVELTVEYQQELDEGRKPDRQRYLSRHPELSSVIAECLDGLDLLHGGKSGISSRSRVRPATRLPDPAPLSTAAPLGDFQIVGEIARGGMGVVYEAVELSLGRRVALKVLPFAATVDPRHLQRFKIEAQAAAMLHHTHIVPIYGVGCERGVHFYAMQLIEGQSLATVIQQLRAKEGRVVEKKPSSNVLSGDQSLPATGDERVAPIESQTALRSTADVSMAVTAGNTLASEGYIRRIVRLMIQAAEGLEHAHQSGVVHRDIKPANLLVDRSGNLWITDFGLAQLQSEQGMTRSSDMLGTFRYMSPEQTGGQRAVLDHRTDIYSLGATFYELLTLEPAFSASSHQELFYQILHTDPRRPRELNRALPAELDTIVLKTLSKNPADRYATAAEFAADLQRYLEHQPILARPPTLVDRARKWARRHPAFVVAGVLSLAVIAVASMLTTSLVAIEQQKTKNEQHKTEKALEGQKARAEDAERHFQQAKQAVDTLFQISEEELADRPAEAARKRILEVVLSYYEAFVEERRGDEASQSDLALVQEKVKSILHELNVLQRAIDKRLLENAAVQQELKLSEDQRERLQTLLGQWSGEEKAFFESMHSLTEEARRSRLVAQAEERETALAELLTVAQMQRFRQVTIQSRGLFAFKDPDVVKELGLTAAQRKKIRDIEGEMFATRFRPPQGFPAGPPPEGRPDRPRPNGDHPEGEPNRPDGEPNRPGPRRDGGPPGRPEGRWQRPEFRMAVKEWIDKALAILTPEQLEKWQKLTGEPFAGLDQPGFFGPGPK